MTILYLLILFGALKTIGVGEHPVETIIRSIIVIFVVFLLVTGLFV